jgi:hypothetical protein
MHPYQTRKLTEGPDVSDIKTEGRASHVGKLGKRGYNKSAAKAKTRRNLKRADKAKVNKAIAREGYGY